MSSRWLNELHNPHHKKRKLLYLALTEKAATPSTSSTTEPARSLGGYTGAFTAGRTFAAIGTVTSTRPPGKAGVFEIQAGTAKVIKTFDMQGNPDGSR